MDTLSTVQGALETLRNELQSLNQQIDEDGKRSGQPDFTPDDWKRLGGNRVAEGHISKAIKALERAIISLE